MSNYYADQQNLAAKCSSLLELLRLRSENDPDKVAYTFLADGETETDTLTYRLLDQRARAIAAKLQSCSVMGDRVLLIYPSGLEFITAFFGCLYAGVLAVPAYPPRQNHHLSRLESIVFNSQAKIVLTTTSVLAIIKNKTITNQILNKLTWLETDTIPTNLASDWQEPIIDRNSLAFLQYTSGSTGMPKGVMVSHGNLLHNLELTYRCFEFKPNNRALVWLPLYHDMGLIGGVLQPLYAGIPCVLIPPEIFIKKPFCWLQAISRYRATTSGGPNFGYELCIRRTTREQRASLDLSSWEVAFIGSEPIRAKTLELFFETFKFSGFRWESFYPCYGMAEATLLVSGSIKSQPPLIYPVSAEILQNNQVNLGTKDSREINYIVGCGHGWLDQNILIVDPESLTPCTPSQVGEIWVSSSSVAQGYWNQPQETEKTFRAYVANTNEGPFLRTGDLGFIQEGELFVTGRIKDLMIFLGRNYYPQDIETTVVESHPALRPDCGSAFSVEIEQREKLVIVQEIERSFLRKLNPEEVITAIRRAVTEQYGLPIHAVLLLKTASLPKTSSGKVQRSACREGFLNDTLALVSHWKS